MAAQRRFNVGYKGKLTKGFKSRLLQAAFEGLVMVFLLFRKKK